MGLLKDPADAGYAPVTLEAHDLVFGDRQADYGHPLDDFDATAMSWTAFLRKRGLLRDGAVLEGEDIGPLMVLFKMMRQANFRKRDNLTDGAGYCETTQRVIHERARRAAPLVLVSTPGSNVTFYDPYYPKFEKPPTPENS